MENTVKLYGERNSGTVYLKSLMALNLDINLLNGNVPHKLQRRFELPKDMFFDFTTHKNLGWKHRVAPSQKEIEKFSNKQEIKFVTIWKNPYTYIASLYKRHQLFKGTLGTFEEFINVEWEPVRREKYFKPYKNPVEIWNIKNKSYLELKTKTKANVLNIRFEEMLLDPKAIIENISESFSLNKSNNFFTNRDNSTKRQEQEKDTKYYQDYYLKKKWIETFTSEQIRLINNNLDKDFAQEIGYEIIDPNKLK